MRGTAEASSMSLNPVLGALLRGGHGVLESVQKETTRRD